jgi:predicted permease
MNMLQDFRYAIRSLRRRPGFALVAGGTLAVGIGATTAIFSVANAVLLRSLPYPDAHELVVVWEDDISDPSRGVGGQMATPNFRDVRAEASSLESFAQYTDANLTVTGLGAAEVVPGGAVTSDFFRVFGAEPILGRGFTEEESRHEGPDAVVISESFWRARLGGDPGVLGRTLMVAGRPHPVVGVAPAGFDFPAGARLWIPYQNDDEGCGRGCAIVSAVGRLAAGATLGGARSEIAAVGERLRAEYPDENADMTLRTGPLLEQVVGDVETALWVLLGAVGMVLLIACANVANLLLVRGGGRRLELAVRSALGASRRRVLAQLMTENAVLALVGGAGGTLLAAWGISLLVGLAPEDLPRLDGVGLDGSTLLFALGMIAMTTLVFGLAPALRLAGGGVAELVKGGSRGRVGERRGRRLRAAVLAGQVALSVILLLGAGLMLRSLVRMQSVELGLDTEQVAVFRLSLPTARYPGPDERVRFMARIEERLAGIPGVEAVATTVAVPLGPVNLFGSFARPELPEPDPTARPAADYRGLGVGAAELLGIEVVSGRSFRETDRHGAEPVALISRTAAERYWPGEDPVGKRIDVHVTVGYEEAEPRTIVGVVEDFRARVTGEPPARMMVPYAQTGASFPHVLLRYQGVSAASVLGAARAELASLDPELPMAQPGTLDDFVAAELAAPRFYLVLLGLFAAMAVALAAVGIYGLVAFTVVRRTREIGMRIALGARVDEVVRMVVWEGVAPALVGLALGVAGALALGRVIAGILYQVRPTDPATYAGTAVLLLLVVAAATALPALRASRIPPADALRSE